MTNAIITAENDGGSSKAGQSGADIFKALIEKQPVSLETLERLKSLIHTKSETELKDRWESKGFTALNINLQLTRFNDAPKQFLVKQFDRYYTQTIPGLTLQIQNILQVVFVTAKEYILDDGGEYSQLNFALYYGANQGQMTMMYFSLKRVSPGRYNSKFGLTTGTFEIGPSILVVSKSKENFFESKKTFELIPMATEITENHIEQLLQITFIRVTHLMNQFESTV